jgi:hypothetical protein
MSPTRARESMRDLAQLRALSANCPIARALERGGGPVGRKARACPDRNLTVFFPRRHGGVR